MNIPTNIFTILLILKASLALEYNKQQRYNPSTDFLLHEGGIIQNGPKKDSSQVVNSYNINQNKDNRDYAAQFPALKPPTTSQTQAAATNLGPQRNPTSPNGKRDYVAPQYPTPKPVQQNNHQSTGNIGNYASQFPALKPTQQSNHPTTGKIRDYVAPQYTTPKPVPQNNQGSTGKVKDLVNFYDNKNQNLPQGTPSYSSVIQGNKHGQTSSTKVTQPTQSTSTAYTTKPMSFSSVVAGSNKPNNQATTLKPSTRPSSSTSVPRPGSPVLPSSIVNSNRGTNGNSPSDAELATLSEELLRKDINNAAKYITINFQEKTTSQSREDKAPLPLITASPDVWNISTIQKFIPLLDNYERDTLVNEYVTPQERTEENAFMDEIMATTVMRHLMTFLKTKGYVTLDPRQQRDFVKQLWFTLYSRGKGKISSSSFEHIFVSELKNGDVSGLHNWIYFAREEAANRINYLGHLKYLQLNDRGAVMKIHFNQQGVDKPVNSLFVGTSPELEFALYTLCFVTRADNECKLKLANKDIEITTHTFRYRSKNYIGSAYPVI